jgi:hypothetical protein
MQVKVAAAPRRRGKKPTVAATAIARELAALIPGIPGSIRLANAEHFTT